MSEQWLQRMEEKRLRDEEEKLRREEQKKQMEEKRQRTREEKRRQRKEVWRKRKERWRKPVERWRQRMEEGGRKRMEEEGRQRMEEDRRMMEERRQRMEEKRQLIELLRTMLDGEDLEPLIEYMGANSMDVEFIDSGVVNEDTEVLSSLEQERKRMRVQRLKVFLREQLRHLLAWGKGLLREQEREREQQRLADEEKLREWEEDWKREDEREQEQEVLEEEGRQRMEEDRRMMEEKRQLIERLRTMLDGEDLEPLIEYMGVDSMDVEFIESGVVNEDTEVLSSLEQERKRSRVQRLKVFLREQMRHLLARGKGLLREQEREREQQRLADEEMLREWEEDWKREDEREQEQEVLELESLMPAPEARVRSQEPLLTEDVMDGLPSIESRVVNEDTEQLQPLIGGMQAIESGVVNEDTEEQQPLIGGMEADSSDVASIIFGVLNQDTEVHLSLEREQEQRQELGSFPQAPGARVDLEWIFVIVNFVLELPSAVFDQFSSVHKPQFALLSMLMSFAALFICIVELVYKCRKEKVKWKWRGTLPWLYYPSRRHKPFGSFKDIIGLVCAICQCVVATIAYNFYIRHADNPIKISVLPVIFAFGLLCSKFLTDRQESRSTTRPPVSRGDIHHNLTRYC